MPIRLMRTRLTSRRTDLRVAEWLFSAGAIALFVGGVRVLTSMVLTDVQLLFGLGLVVMAALQSASIAVGLGSRGENGGR